MASGRTQDLFRVAMRPVSQLSPLGFCGSRVRLGSRRKIGDIRTERHVAGFQLSQADGEFALPPLIGTPGKPERSWSV